MNIPKADTKPMTNPPQETVFPEKTFGEIVKPVMKWLAKNKHPHTSIIIEATRAEMVEGVEVVATDEFVQD